MQTGKHSLWSWCVLSKWYSRWKTCQSLQSEQNSHNCALTSPAKNKSSLMKSWTVSSIVTATIVDSFLSVAKWWRRLRCGSTTVLVDKETAGHECPSSLAAPRDLRLWGFLLPWQEALAVRPVMYTFGKHSGREGAWVTCAFKKRGKKKPAP